MKNRLREELEAMLGLHTGDSFTADNVHTLVNGILAIDEVGGFEYVEYDDAFQYPQEIGKTADSITGLGPATKEMIHTIFIMPNKEENPDATLMIVVEEKDPDSDTYQYVYVGNINDLPSDVLTKGSIINDLTTGGIDKPLSAEQGRTLNSHVNYATCGSNAEDQVKLIPDSGFELSTHLRLLVKMTNTNTHATPKFNINNTGVKDVWYNGSVASDINTWSAGEVLDVYYDGTEYIANTHGGAQFSTGEKVGDVGIDDEPTAGSENLVKSGGVYDEISQLDQEVLKIKDTASFTESGYISYTTGEVTGNGPTYLHSPRFSLDNIKKIAYDLKIGGAAASVAFYNASEEYMQGISISATASGTIDLSQQAYSSAKYVIFSTEGSYANKKGELYTNSVLARVIDLEEKATETETEIEQLNQNVENVSEKLSPLEYPITFDIHGFIDYGNGYRQSSESALCSDYLPILDEYTNLEFDTLISSGGAAVAFFTTPNDSGYMSSISIQGESPTVTKGNINLKASQYLSAKYVVISSYSYPQVNAKFINNNSIYKELSDLDERIGVLEDKTANKFKDIKILIFGDSITDCMALNVDETTNTSTGCDFVPGGYYPEPNVYKEYKMWPQLLAEYFDTNEIRCYAKFGATYKDMSNHTDPRQNLSYQILVAENDLTNPNNVFPTVGNYYPDVVIFALGTNDNTFGSGDSYATAMGKTVYIQDGGSDVKVNIPDTLAALDLTKFHEAIRYAFLKTKQLFPTALFLCVLPIQRWNYPDLLMGDIHNYIKEMAETYSIPTIDGAYAMGVVRDLEANSRLGTLLKDGLHPNEKGQNVYARMLITEIKSRYISFDGMNS